VPTPALAFDEITKNYRSFFRKSFRALDRFSLEVAPGEIFGFLGPNGAGKTTAIHLALGLDFPSSGSGTLLGSPFGTAKVRKRVGFLAENVSFYSHPAARLVRFYGVLNGVRDPQLAQRTKDLLQSVDLTDVGRKKVSKFSRGMLQRVGLAQALVNDPELLILDEPTSALDPAARVLVREVLLSAKRAGKTVFLSSHLLSEIELVCDRVAIISKGRLIRQGTVSQLLERRGEYEISVRNIHACDFPDVRSGPDGAQIIRSVAQDQRRVIEQVWAKGGEIVSVTPVRRSLEEVFLELTGEEEKSA
jgi:ABC-2 type transport system ATP-binding protein